MAMLTPAQNPRGLARMIFTRLLLTPDAVILPGPPGGRLRQARANRRREPPGDAPRRRAVVQSGWGFNPAAHAAGSPGSVTATKTPTPPAAGWRRRRFRRTATRSIALLHLDLGHGDDLLAVLLGDRAGDGALLRGLADRAVVLLVRVGVE